MLDASVRMINALTPSWDIRLLCLRLDAFRGICDNKFFNSCSFWSSCSNMRDGGLTRFNRASDGIFGFGQHGISIQLNYFDPECSSTSALISCLDQRCRNGVEMSDASCSRQNDQCTYTIQYEDGSGIFDYISDLMHFASFFEGSVTTNSSIPVVFGNLRDGGLTRSNRAIDGIFGFGQYGMSVISQLSSRGIVLKVFSHCLKEDSSGGGILVQGIVR